MAGVELIGIVLASLPLAISAIEHYRDGLDPFKDYVRYDCTLKSFRTQLRLQQRFFQDTLKLLLLRYLSPHEVSDLFPDAGQHMDVGVWATPEIDMKLHQRLGSRYDDFMDAVREMESVMTKLMKGLEIEPTLTDSLPKPNWQDISRVSLSTLKIEKGKWEWRKLKWSFGRKRRESLLRSFERWNYHLAKYVGQWEILAPSPDSRSKALSQHYWIVREHACKVYNAVENSWKCRHPCSHTVNLQLESRGSGEGLPHFMAALSFQDQSSGSQISEQKWVETRLHVAESNVRIPPGSACQRSLTMQSVEESPSANALDQSSSTMSSPPGGSSMRSQLPVELYESPWLSESWSKNDIWFFSSGVDCHKRPNIERPYISRSFKARSDQDTSTSEEVPVAQTDHYSHLIINKTLFALGILLIELALNRPFEELRTDVMSSEPSASNRSYTTVDAYQVATSLIDRVYDEQGTQYGMKRLELDAFRAAVYEGVLVPLEEDLN
ncbi:MAG: hypothetical protein L6R36_008607, partial [Xanthoria steineri]